MPFLCLEQPAMHPHPVSALPSALLDLTMLRLGSSSRVTAAGLARWQRSSGCRRMYQATALQTSPPPSFEEFLHGASALQTRYRKETGSLAVKPPTGSKLSLHPVQELEKRVQALDEAIESGQMEFSPSFYSEEELLALYEDVLSTPMSPSQESADQTALEAVRRAEEEEDQRIIEAAETRLLDPFDKGQREPVVYRRILSRVHEILSRKEAIQNLLKASSSTVPLGVLSIRECEALVRTSVKAGDAQAAEIALNIMKRDKLALPENSVTDVLKLYSKSGNAQAADNLLANFLTEAPTELQRHLHVQAHLKSESIDELPTSALDLLHNYEGQNVPAPMQTYTAVITSLFSRPSSLGRAHAWDLFSHMRYVAHPTPDALLYTLMIRACANPITTRYSSEPEKALDLWTEMTVDQKIQPTVGSYNAIILACARSGTKTYVNEAFRLARQMLDSHRDARGYSPFRPDKKTFCALLEGAKRIGDLGRARWILAEMVKGVREDDVNGVEAEIDEEVMMHVFHAYAAYKPPFSRAATVIVKNAPPGSSSIRGTRPESEEIQMSVQVADGVSASSSTSLAVEEDDDRPSFAHIPPQSRAEVIREAKLLFNRILQDQSDAASSATLSLPFAEKKFKNVELTTRLLTSYLSIFYRHASLEASRELFWTLFEEVGVQRSARTYVEALERCGNARRGPERESVTDFADELWAKWKEVEEAGYGNGKPINARLVERAHVAMIRVLSITDNLDRALTHLRSFAAKYPPTTIRMPSPKYAFQSTRTSLQAARPLVRMTSATEVPDDHVPPLMTFRDLEVLHHRLIDEERPRDIGYVTWLCKAYQGSLRMRRDGSVKAKPGAGGVEEGGQKVVAKIPGCP
ncbi:unnamed protein product [Cyclocybe aegerita]|uniref:Pentatricopeptide repeat-containing protein n=1 Tax=Cyclocybe aegerita TaxID=1973307 RepID=A0A8S0WYL2_CYCAE|nr:unnamed protein product [Cyclocybe aegerita]